MPLQNRVAPDGTLHADKARGMLLGNRGILHDPGAKTLTGRRWTTKAWIACALSFKGRRREVWGRQIGSERPGWTELFFLDEITALAAGHRPCFFCRHAEAVNFLKCACIGLDRPQMRAPQLDRLLHGERRLSARSAATVLDRRELEELPDGAVVATPDGFFALRRGRAMSWRHRGYAKPAPLHEIANGPISLITPRTVIAALGAGYYPAWHPSAS